MNTWLLPTHIACVGIWLGCVLTEALFEHALLGQGRAQELVLVALHKRVDAWVEIPAFLGVLVTGGLMLAGAPSSPLLHAKIAFGAVAIVVNAYCVGLVWRRAAAAQAGRWDEFSRLDHRQHTMGAVVLLGLGVYLYAQP